MSEREVAFIRDHPQAVLVTHRRDGGIQASPIRVLIDSSGEIFATTRAKTAKARNLARVKSCAICVMVEGWSGPWLTIEAEAQITELPEALDSLRELYLARDGRLADPDVFAQLMHDEERIIVRFTPVRSAGPALRG
jgi:PPOX class probable F420-dependent enzyme